MIWNFDSIKYELKEFGTKFLSTNRVLYTFLVLQLFVCVCTIQMYLHVSECMWMCAYGCVHIYVSVHMCVYTFMCIHVYEYMCVRMLAYVCMFKCVCRHVCVHMYS